MRSGRALFASASMALAAACGAGASDDVRAHSNEAPAGEPAADASPPIDARPNDATSATDAASDAIDAGAIADAAAEADADADAAPALGFDCSGDANAGDVPADLACTGLYASWPDKRIAAGVRAYAPGVDLWSDGADKSRFLYLPPGTRIDTSDMNEWIFPLGTKLWKEFRLNGHRVETRFLWKRAAGWVRTTYAWSQDESSAHELTTGAQNVLGTPYEIPTQAACTTCHQGRVDGVLGLEAIGLSLPNAQGETMAKLVSDGLVTQAPSAPLTIPGTAAESYALGWLHGNCGNACHNRSPQALAGATGLFMRLDVQTLATTQSTDTYATAVNVPSSFQPYANANFLRIAPGDPSRSCIAFRISTRDTQGEGFQMPPIDSHVVDAADAQKITAWIAAMSP